MHASSLPLRLGDRDSVTVHLAISVYAWLFLRPSSSLYRSISLGVMATANLPAGGGSAESKAAVSTTISLMPQLVRACMPILPSICKRMGCVACIMSMNRVQPAGVINIMQAWAGCQFEGGSMILLSCILPLSHNKCTSRV